MLVDTGSATNVLFHDVVAQMGTPDFEIRPYILLLVGFTERNINSLGVVNLPVFVNGTTWSMEFLIVDAPSSYNGLIGQPPLNQFKATVSTYALTMEVRTSTGLFATQGDRNTGRECFLAARGEVEQGAGNVINGEDRELSKKL